VKSSALKGGEQWVEVCGCGMVHPPFSKQSIKSRRDNAYDPENGPGSLSVSEWTGWR